MQIEEQALSQEQNIFTVTQLNQTVRDLLEDTFTHIWVEGEISNFAAPHSGHWYFSLKDASAQVRCAMFKGSQRKLGFTPKDGMQILIRAKVSLYPARGDYQLIADFMEERGEGKLRRAYEALKKKLEAAGLFAEEHKQALPAFPASIGVITSPTGAAIRDILNVLKRRYPCAPVIIYPTLVQGDAAAPAIVKAIELANQRRECDVLILARGGGSLEDLWPFNEEIVAHAIYKSALPIISGVGHEVDFTIADYVADLRAPTPSAAAALAAPDRAELQQQLSRCLQQITRLTQKKISAIKSQLEWTDKHLQQQHPKRKLLEKIQRLDFYELTLMKLQQQCAVKKQTQLRMLESALLRQQPMSTIQSLQGKLALSGKQLENLISSLLHKQHAALANAASTLDALSPLATLKRGYAIATHDKNVLRYAEQVQHGDNITLTLMSGTLNCIVD
jgi:exodeoxyribonuclease VII large subunit